MKELNYKLIRNYHKPSPYLLDQSQMVEQYGNNVLFCIFIVNLEQISHCFGVCIDDFEPVNTGGECLHF